MAAVRKLKTFVGTVCGSDSADDYCIKVRARDINEAAEMVSAKIRSYRQTVGRVYEVKKGR